MISVPVYQGTGNGAWADKKSILEYSQIAQIPLYLNSSIKIDGGEGGPVVMWIL